MRSIALVSTFLLVYTVLLIGGLLSCGPRSEEIVQEQDLIEIEPPLESKKHERSRWTDEPRRVAQTDEKRKELPKSKIEEPNPPAPLKKGGEFIGPVKPKEPNVATLPAAPAAPPQSQGPPIIDPDSTGPWVELFNGEDLTGWASPEGVVFDGKTESADKRFVARDGMLVAVPRPGTNREIRKLWTVAQFPKDFEIRLEMRASFKADSGLHLRDKIKQLQVRDYNAIGPYFNLKKFKPQDWNEIIAIVRGRSAFCTCNGEVLETALPVTENGPIGLESDMGQVEFRNIRLRELK